MGTVTLLANDSRVLSSSLSSSWTISIVIPDPLSPPLPIVICFQQVFRDTSCVDTEQFYVGLRWSSCFDRPCEGVHRSTSLMSSSPLLQQCLASLFRLTWMIFVMSGRSSYLCCFVGCYLKDLFNIARSILLYLPSSFFSLLFVNANVVYQYSSINTTTARKKLRFILLVRSDFHMIDRLLLVVHAFASRVLMSVSVDGTLLPS